MYAKMLKINDSSEPPEEVSQFCTCEMVEFWRQTFPIVTRPEYMNFCLDDDG
jgi:hypothetical protein